MRERLCITIRGVVQGVGFRPFVYRLARRHSVAGFVCNTGNGVLVEAEGNRGVLVAFLRDVERQAPPLAGIAELDVRSIPILAERFFYIKSSIAGNVRSPFIPPDIATCSDCLDEFFDPADRRYLYPFINCTNCGPRFTIISGTPYDRPLTSMSSFAMCPACRREYENPEDRRFHAQPNACPACGPHVFLHVAEHGVVAEKQEALTAGCYASQR
jgi:hydrogenase maturation protein HypF